MRKLLTLFAAVLLAGSVMADSFALTNSQIVNNATGKNSYSNNYTIDGNWGGRWCINNNSGTYSLQLGYNTNSSKSAYNSHLAITMPDGASNISILIETQNGTASGRTFYACNANDKGTASSGDYGSASTSTQNGSATISITGTPSVIYVYPNGIAYLKAVTVSYETSEPGVGTITPEPTSVSVTSAAVNGAITIAYDGITDMDNVDDVALYNDADHTIAFTGEWLTAEWHDDNKTSIDYTIAENTGAARTAYIYLYAIDDNTNDVEKVIEVTQAAAPVDPTISFRDSTLDVGYTLDLSKLFESNSEGTVTYTITSGGSYATLNGKNLTGVVVGTVTIQASQAAATGYKAKAVTNTITVQEHVVKAGTYEINPLGTAFWGCEAINKNNATEDEINFTGTQDDVTVTIKNGKKANAWIGASQTRVYADGYTMKFEAPTGFSLTAISFTADGNNWAGTHTADVGTMTDSKNWAGTAESVTITFGGTCRIVSVSVTYIVTPSVANPSVSGETPFLNSSTITLECETDGATIYYTLDGEDPDNTATEYTAPFAISETTTIKAIAYKDAAHSDILSMTFTKASAITVAEALELADKTNNVFVAGIVSGIITAYTSENGYASYYISDDGLTTSQLQCYKGIGEGIDVLAVGDKVVVKGDYTTSYGKELKANNTLKSRLALTSVSIDDSKAAKAYEAGDEFELDKVKAMATYADASTLDVTDWAEWTPDVAPTINADGNVDITATWCEKVGEKSIAVTVNTYAVTFDAPEYGTLVVKNGETPITSGDEFVKGTVLTVVATPESGYQLATLTAGGEDILSTKSFTIGTADVEVVATFSQATALDNTEVEGKAVKVLRNGILLIEKNGHTYNAMGQLVK